MERRRSARRQRCARSYPGTKTDFQFVNVRPEDKDQKARTRSIIRANAAHFHWRHNRPPQDTAISERPGRGTDSRRDNARAMNSAERGSDIIKSPPLYYSDFPSALVNYSIEFNAEVVLPALFPDGIDSLKAKSSFVQLSISHSYMLHIFITGALMYSALGDTPSERIASDIFRSRAKMVRSLNIAIRDPVEACKDINILAILALAKLGKAQRAEEIPLMTPNQGPLKSLQLLSGLALSEIDHVHFDGLSKLIELKGGLEKVELPGLASIISLAGLLVGTRECTAPRFPVVPMSCKSIEFVFDDEGADFDTDQDIYIVLMMLNSYTAMVDDFCEGRKIVTASELIDHRNMTQHALLSLPPRVGSSECYRLAALIYSLLVTFPLPYCVAPFKYLVTQLRIALTDWDGDDHMLVWILTIGGIGSTGLVERVWFMKELRDAARRIGVRSWIELKATIKKGPWHDATNDRDGQSLWLESGIAN